MAKQVIRLTESELKHIVKDVIKEELGADDYREPLLEMSRINTNENGKRGFPYNKFVVRVWSTDHEPPHFHVIREGWDLSFRIDNGELLNIKSKGKNDQVYQYIIANVQHWLQSPCAILPMITNQQNAKATWIQIHEK